MNASHLVSETSNLLITPIGKTYKSHGGCARRDWDEQMDRESDGKQMMWDDSKFNKSKVGDILFVWHYGKRVTCHEITGVKIPAERLSTWSDNVGQGKRNVIEIGSAFASIPWYLWLLVGGHKRCMGTGSVVSARNSIIAILRADYFDSS
jgi:hypothetical protein